MPLFEYRCPHCGGGAEVLSRTAGATPPAVACARCGHPEMARAVSGFSFRATHPAKYNEGFRENMLPFLKSQPETSGLFHRGGESDEATAYKLTEAIGERVDSVLEKRVFDKLSE